MHIARQLKGKCTIARWMLQQGAYPIAGTGPKHVSSETSPPPYENCSIMIKKGRGSCGIAHFVVGLEATRQLIP